MTPMRLLPLILMVTVAGCGSGSGIHTTQVDPLPRIISRDGPRPGLKRYQSIASRAADSLGIADLTSATEEIRLWWEFDLGGGLQLLQLRKDGGRWIAVRVPAGHQSDPYLQRSVQQALSHLDRLNQLAQGSTQGIAVADGGWYLLEWSVQGTVHVAGADNPSSFCSVYDRELLAAVRGLAPERDSTDARCKDAP